MKAQGIDERDIYIDQVSGKDFNRLRCQNMQSRFCSGNLIYIDAFDQIDRNYEAIISE